MRLYAVVMLTTELQYSDTDGRFGGDAVERHRIDMVAWTVDQGLARRERDRLDALSHGFDVEHIIAIRSGAPRSDRDDITTRARSELHRYWNPIRSRFVVEPIAPLDNADVTVTETVERAMLEAGAWLQRPPEDVCPVCGGADECHCWRMGL